MRIKLFISLLLLAGCARTPTWKCEETLSSSPQFNSAQLSFAPENIFNGIGIQLLKGEFGLLGFCNVYSRQIPSAEGILWVEGQPLYFKGTLLQGKQRLQLPNAVTEAMIQALLAGEKVIVSLEGYSTHLNSDTFSKRYQKF